MKIKANYGSIILKALVALVCVAPFFSSCANLDEIWEKIDEVEARLDSLEADLNDQIMAFDEFSKGKATISECKKNENGSHTITLSNGTKFTVYPKSQEYNSLLTVVEENEVRYWAVYDGVGNATALKDSKGNKIPVEAELPVVEEVDGEYILSIGGEEYTTGFTTEDIVTIFSDYELLKDDSDNVYAVTFTFGDAMTFTVPLADYKGLTFHLPGDVNAKVIKDFYVGNGATSRLKLGMEGVVDYVMQIPDGWRTKEVKDEYTGETFLDVTAPVESAVAAGAAVASGELKAVAVLEDSKSMVAKLELSTSPFKKFTTTASNAVIEKYNGVDKVIYGLSAFADYDQATVVAGAADKLTASAEGVSDSNVDMPLATLLGAELSAGERYVLWAIPVFYKEADGEAEWIVADDLLVSYEFGAVSALIEIEDEDILFNDVTLSVKVAGVDSYYGGTSVWSDDVLQSIAFDINNDLVDPVTEPMTYEGSAFSFPTSAANAGVEVLSEETYLTWVVLVEEGKTEFTAEDVVYEKYTLPGVTAGGTIEVTAGTANVTKTTAEASLSAEGATRIYYAWMEKRQADRFDDETLAEYLLSDGKMVAQASVNATATELNPGTEMTLIAMATDSKGKYGPVKSVQCKTVELVYNTLQVSLALQGLVSDTSASVEVSVTGGDAAGYAYWIGRNTDEFWVSGEGSGVDNKTKAAEQKIALYPTGTDVTRAMLNHPMANNVISMTGLTPGCTYYVVVLAKDENGSYSRAAVLPVVTLGKNLGNLVLSTDQKWIDAKEWIVSRIDWVEESFRSNGESAPYAFNIYIPTDLTAFIAPFTPDDEDHPEIADKIMYIEEACMKPIDRNLTIDPTTLPEGVVYNQLYNSVDLPSWVDDEGDVIGGGMFTPYTTHVHGAPDWKGVTYFSSAGHNGDTCPMWDSGECSQYKAAKDKFADYCSLDYWRTYVAEEFHDPDWGRPLTDPEKIEAAAQSYYKLYSHFFADVEPVAHVNNGDPLHVYYNWGAGPDDEGIVHDVITVVLKDNSGNYYEPMYIPVENHWK